VAEVDEAVVTRVVERLEGCERVLFVTGAGISVDSGLPTYRGIGGLYDGVETDEGVPIEVALSEAMFQRDPALAWKYIMQIERACRGASPNRAHRIIAELEQHFEVWVLTQNVDGLHRVAGSQRVIDIHGDVRTLLCTSCSWTRCVDDYEHLACPPSCPDCGEVVRPDVVLFGGMLPAHKVARLRAAAKAGLDAVFSVGTTSVFPYIAEPVLDARRRGALAVEINPGRTQLSHLVEHRLQAGATAALAAIMLAWRDRSTGDRAPAGTP